MTGSHSIFLHSVEDVRVLLTLALSKPVFSLLASGGPKRSHLGASIGSSGGVRPGRT